MKFALKIRSNICSQRVIIYEKDSRRYRVNHSIPWMPEIRLLASCREVAILQRCLLVEVRL